MSTAEALRRRIRKISGDDKPRFIVVETEDQIPPHGPKDTVIVLGEKYKNV